MITNIISNKPVKLFFILSGFFIANALIAEIMGAKIFSLEASLGIDPINLRFFGNNFSFNLTAGVLLWPIVFIMTDIINEYYGVKGVRFLSYFTCVLIAFAFIIFQIGIGTIPADFWESQFKDNGVPSANAAYNTVLGQSQWIIIGSLLAFLVGQIVDVLVFHRIKKATGEQRVWLRATGSTFVSQFIDSFVVLFIAFYIGPQISGKGKPWDFSLVMTVCIGNYLYKIVVAIILTPAIYGVHHIIEKYLGKEQAQAMKEAALSN